MPPATLWADTEAPPDAQAEAEAEARRIEDEAEAVAYLLRRQLRRAEALDHETLRAIVQERLPDRRRRVKIGYQLAAGGMIHHFVIQRDLSLPTPGYITEAMGYRVTTRPPWGTGPRNRPMPMTD